jgi:NADH-quinone oxidoreductase subunit E
MSGAKNKQAAITSQEVIGLLDSVINKYGTRREVLVSILQDIQSHLNWLPEEVLAYISERLNIPLIDVYGVATFYRSFSLKPRGKHIVTVCLGTACHVRGGQRIVAEIERRYSVKPGETTEDQEFTLETVNCLGCCAIGPIVVIDGEYHGEVSTRKAITLVEKCRSPRKEVKEAITIQVNVKCPQCGKSLMDHEYKIDGHPSVKVTVEFKGKRGWVRLSSLYGSYNVAEEFPVPMGSVVRFFCPVCGSELKGTRICEQCNAPMIPLRFTEGGLVQICSRRGCKKHLIEFEDLEAELRTFYDRYSTFFR